MTHQKTVLVLAGDVKGQPFITECKKLGYRVFLLTRKSLADRDWPRQDIDEMFFMDTLTHKEDVLKGVDYLSRQVKIDRVVPMDDFDVEIASAVREHLRIPGMGETTARYFRDKLAMRGKAAEEGIREPRFVQPLNVEDIQEFVNVVPSPWLLKPRSQAGSAGIQKIQDATQLWQKINDLGDQQSGYILEEFIPGDIYHVDSILFEHDVLFVEVSKYGRPPLEVAHQGGIFMTCIQDRQGGDAKTLRKINTQLLTAFGLKKGVAHTEFIKSHADGQFYFLETGARVGGAYISNVILEGTGINLWEEWAKIEVLGDKEMYQLPKVKKDYAGIALCLAHQEWPDTSAYRDPEIAERIHKAYHAGLILKSKDPHHLETLLQDYVRRFTHDFLAVTGYVKKIDR